MATNVHTSTGSGGGLWLFFSVFISLLFSLFNTKTQAPSLYKYKNYIDAIERYQDSILMQQAEILGEKAYTAHTKAKILQKENKTLKIENIKLKQENKELRAIIDTIKPRETSSVKIEKRGILFWKKNDTTNVVE